jgi:hypothetical protein
MLQINVNPSGQRANEAKGQIDITSLDCFAVGMATAMYVQVPAVAYIEDICIIMQLLRRLWL